MSAAIHDNDVVVSNPEILGGEPCFKGTRVPVAFLFMYLSWGDDIQEFIEEYPTVTREQAAEAIAQAGVKMAGENSSTTFIQEYLDR